MCLEIWEESLYSHTFFQLRVRIQDETLQRDSESCVSKWAVAFSGEYQISCLYSLVNSNVHLNSL